MTDRSERECRRELEDEDILETGTDEASESYH